MSLLKALLISFLSIEVLFFLSLYVTGPQGLSAINKLKESNQELHLSIYITNNEITKLKNKMKRWQADLFYKEKLAREELHMARANEIIFLKNNKH